MDVWSLAPLVAVLVVAYALVLVLHELTHSLFDNRRYTLWLYDFLASAELIASTLTLAVILAQFGLPVFAVCAVANLAVVAALPADHRFPGRASTLYPIRDVLLGNDTIVNALLSSVAMVGGGILAAVFLLPLIGDVFRAVGVAGADVSNVLCGKSVSHSLQGLLMEAATTLLQVLIYRRLLSSNNRVDPGLTARLFAFATVLIASRGWAVSGGYANSMLASSVHHQCSDITHLDFLKVYWLGPLLGMLVAMAIYGELRGVQRKVKIM